MFVKVDDANILPREDLEKLRQATWQKKTFDVKLLIFLK